MHDCYVTPTLINSWLYFIKSRDEAAVKAEKDFLNCLNKVKTEPTEAMLKGIEFENNVQAFCENKLESDGLKPEYLQCVKEVAETVNGGIWQQTVQREIKVEDMNVLVYGRTDVIKENKIIDLKFVGQYVLGKYYHSVQHLFYMYCTQIPNFTYLVCDGSSIYPEDYTAGKYLDMLVASNINEFFRWLKIANLYDIYLEKWKGNKQ